jgi:uncharacterized protein YegL
MITEIAFILDRSSSMESIRDAAIAGFNDFLRDQQAAPGTTRLSLVFFDTVVETRYDAMPVSEILPLDHETYVPNGCTALLDAIGATIDSFARRFDAAPADQKPGHVAIAILTDGEENSSRQFSWHQIADRIAHQTNQNGWDFLFLGASADSIATASKMNISIEKATIYVNDAVGQQAASKSVSRKIMAARLSKSGEATAEQLADMDAPLSQILREEDGNRRG